MNLNEVIAATAFMSADDIQQVYQALRRRQEYLTMTTAQTLKIGQRVVFEYRGRQVFGFVAKINTKTVQVHQENERQIWRVAPTLLKAA